jgi:hypothetical protein
MESLEGSDPFTTPVNPQYRNTYALALTNLLMGRIESFYRKFGLEFAGALAIRSDSEPVH